MSRRITALGCGVIVSLIACADTQKIERDIARLDSTVGDLRNFQAEQTTQLSAMQNQLRALSGRMEELEFAQNQKLGTDLSSLKKDLSTLKKRVPPPAIVPPMALDADEALAGTIPQAVAVPFSDALQKIREGNFAEALPVLRSTLDNPDARPWVPYLLFWVAVCYDGTGDNKSALAAYNELLSQYPQHERAPLCLMREASVFVRLGDSKTANLTLKKLIADFPKSVEASHARERLRSL